MTTAAAKKLVGELRALGTRERIEATLNYFPTSQENLGVSVPNIRTVVRSYSKELKSEPPKSVLKFAFDVIACNTLEGRQCAYEIVAKHKLTTSELTIRDLERLAKGVDNWVSVDCFATGLSGQVWRNQQIRDQDVASWGRSKNPWMRRVALASTIPLNLKSRGGSGDVARTIAICKLTVRDEHVMVQKALSWALRTLIAIDSEAVDRFVTRHEGELSALVKREVRKKLTTGRKSG